MSLIYSALNSLDKKHAAAGMSAESHPSVHSPSPSRSVPARWLYGAGVGGVAAVIIGGAALTLQHHRSKEVPQPVMAASATVTPVPVRQTLLSVPKQEARVPARQIPLAAQSPAKATAIAKNPINQAVVVTPAEHHATEKPAIPVTAPLVTVETKTAKHTRTDHASVVMNKSVHAKPTTDDDVNRLVTTAKQAIDTGNKDVAASTLKQLAALLPPESLTLLRLRAWQALRSNDQSQALRLYGQIVDRLPDDVSSSINLAVLKWDAGKHEEARRIVGRLAERRPDSDTVRSYVAQFGEQH